MKSTFGGAALACAVVVALAGCKKKKKPKLVTEEEIGELGKELQQVVAEHQKMTCPRPILRGAPTVGSAHEVFVDAYEVRKGKACAEVAKKHNDKLREVLWNCDDSEGWTKVGGSDGDGSRCVATPWKNAPSAQEVELDKACGDVVASMRKAVTHGAVCSPYLPGRRWFDAGLPRIRTHNAVIVRARAMARAGDRLGAFQLLLDDLRFGQDAVRGGGSLIVAMLSYVTAKRDIAMAHSLLDGHVLTKEQLDTVAAEMDRLLSSTVDFGAVLEDDSMVMAMEVFIPGVLGRDWKPPGEWPKNARLQTPMEDKGKRFSTPRDENALMWMSSSRTAKSMRAACPAKGTFKQCIEGLRANSAAAEAKVNGMKGKSIEDVMSSGGPRETIRESILTILGGIATPAFTKYANRYAHRVARLVALRARVEVERKRLANQACPKDAEALTQAIESVRAHPALAEPLGVSVLDKDGLQMYLVSPPWMDFKPAKSGPRPVRLAKIPCDDTRPAR